MEIAAQVHTALQERGETLATAESLTGGQLAARLTAVPGASRSYLGGVVSYATSVKVDVLGVPADLVATYGVISAECAQAMARGAARLTGATWALATTGVAGPDRQEDHPPGTVHVGLHGPGVTTSVRLALAGDALRDRAAIQDATCTEALVALLEHLSSVGRPGMPAGKNRASGSVDPTSRTSGVRGETRMVLFRRLLGDVLRAQRMRRGMTLREVSAEARVSLGYISEVERGQKEASSELLVSLCSALDLPLSAVLREVSDLVALEESLRRG